ncbi:hypothetical protein EV178_003417 [Coemansia sp. RSA 1646]|nr:hypothetical protein EV178_003417 [Coemansia sp. RSA 1646]KAJ1772912.1 hypothetical protein LPJ74_001050 [Coemansia sp. RSA 1843]KAJ2093487.1 hypothetical protein IW138_000337 [Coemansia sp. RSA 986]
MPPVHTIRFKLGCKSVILRHTVENSNGYHYYYRWDSSTQRPSGVGLLERVDSNGGLDTPHHCCHKKKHRHHHHHLDYRGSSPLPSTYDVLPRRHLSQHSEMNMVDFAVTEIACLVLSLALALTFLFIGCRIRGLKTSTGEKGCLAEDCQFDVPDDVEDCPESNIPLLQKF